MPAEKAGTSSPKSLSSAKRAKTVRACICPVRLEPFCRISAPALATPTSVLGGALLPIAYFTFLLLMNSKTLGDSRPTGAKAIRWNVLMVIATVIASFASSWALWNKGTPGKIGLAILLVLFVAGLAGFISKQKKEA